MYKSKRIFALLLAVIMLASLAACQSSAPAAEASQQPSEEAAPSEAVEAPPAPAEESEAPVEATPEEPVEAPSPYPLTDEVTTLSLFFSISPNLASLLQQMSDVTAFRVAEEVTNVHLDAQISTPETTSEKFNLLIAGAEYPDLFQTFMYSTGEDGGIKDEVIIDLTDYLDEYAPAYSKFLSENPDVKKTYTTENGYYPSIKGLSYNFLQGSIIRKDWLDDGGFEIPKTVDQLEAVLDYFHNDKGAGNAYMFATGNIYLAGAFNVPDGTDGGAMSNIYAAVDGEVQMCYFMDAYKDFIGTLASWYEKGYFSDDFLSVFGSGFATPFVLSDDTGFWDASHDNIGESFAAKYAGEADFYSVPMPMVTVNEGDTIKTGEIYDIGGQSWYVSTQCQQPELAVQYLDWFFTDEGNTVCNYGEEGVAFNYDENGTPIYTDLVTNNPDGLSVMQAQWMYTNFQAPYVQNEDRDNSLYSDENQVAAASVWNSNRSNEYRVYGALTTEESTEYSLLVSDFATYTSEKLLSFILCQSPMSEWEDFLANLKALKADEMLEIRQRAYDRYMAR